MSVCKTPVYERDNHNLSPETQHVDLVRESDSNYNVVQNLKSAHIPPKQTDFAAMQTGISSQSPFVLREA